MKKYFTTVVSLLSLPLLGLAQATDYKLAAPIPGGGDSIPVDGGFTQYAEFLLPFMLSVAAIAALVMFVYGGIEYMTAGGSDRVSRAKGTITSALAGLMIAVFSVLILETINPELVKLNLNITPIQVVPIGSAPPGGSTVPGVGCTGNTDCPPSRPICVEVASGNFQCRPELGAAPGSSCDINADVCIGSACQFCQWKRGSHCCDNDTDKSSCSNANGNYCIKPRGALLGLGLSCNTNEDCESNLCDTNTFGFFKQCR